MKFLLTSEESELLKRIGFHYVLYDRYFDEEKDLLTLTGTQVRDFVKRLFDIISFPKFTHDEKFILCNLGWRITNNLL